MTDETNPETIDEAETDAVADAVADALAEAEATGETPATDEGSTPEPPAVKAGRKRAVKDKAPKGEDAPTAPLEVGAGAYLDGDESTTWTYAKPYNANLALITRETSPGHYLGDHVNPARLSAVAS